jgi:flagellar protein FliO/FliZ
MSQLSAAAHAAVAAAPTMTGAHLFAAGPAAAAPVGAGGVASVTLALLAVLAAIFAVAWLARRVRGFGNRVGNAIEVLADVPLGPKERAVLIRLGAEQVLVGVAPGRVSALHVLREPVEISRGATAAAPPASETRPSFRALLKRSLGK